LTSKQGWHKHFNPDKKTVFVTLFETNWIKTGVLNTPRRQDTHEAKLPW